MPQITKLEDRILQKESNKMDTGSLNTNAIRQKNQSVEEYNIRVGTEDERITGRATHTVSNFVAAILNYDRILILNGIQTQVANIDITGIGIRIFKESQQAIIDGVTFTFTVSGDENEMNLRFDNMGDNEVVLSGNHNDFKGWFTNAGATPINDTGAGNVFTEFVVS